MEKDDERKLVLGDTEADGLKKAIGDGAGAVAVGERLAAGEGIARVRLTSHGYGQPGSSEAQSID